MSERRERKRIGLDDVRKLGEDQIIWDKALPGFGARRRRGGDAVRFFLFYRTKEGRQRWLTIGRFGAPWTVAQARDQARKILGQVADGKDPSADRQAERDALTIAEFCDKYFDDAAAGRILTRRGKAKKASTLLVDRGRIDRHIKPLLGRYAVAAVTRGDIENFMHAVAAGKTAARIKTKARGLARVQGGRVAAIRAVGLLGGIFSHAVRQGIRSDNPVHSVVRFADRIRERRLSDNEYVAFGAALRRAEAEGIWPPAVAATRFLALTGWRNGEVLGLRWSELGDLTRRTATLADDSRTGRTIKSERSIRPISRAAYDLLHGVSRLSGELVFPAARGPGQMTGFKKMFRRIVKYGELPRDITPHTLRHSFASLAGDLGYSEATIGAMVGHKGRSVTSRYVHSADAVLLAAADAVANRTVELMGEDRSDPEVVLLRAS
jgi:integrase